MYKGYLNDYNDFKMPRYRRLNNLSTHTLYNHLIYGGERRGKNESSGWGKMTIALNDSFVVFFPGYNDVGWKSTKMKRTYIDTLAEEGIILDSSYAMPMCSPLVWINTLHIIYCASNGIILSVHGRSLVRLQPELNKIIHSNW